MRARPSQDLDSNLEGDLEIEQRTLSSRARAKLDWLLRTNITTLNTKRVLYSSARASMHYHPSVALLIWLISANHKVPCVSWRSCNHEWRGWTILWLPTTHHTYPQLQPISTAQCHGFEVHMCVVSFPAVLRLEMLASWLVPVGWAPRLPAPKLNDQR